MKEGYDVALICLNGHEVNCVARESPEYGAKHCKDCGAKSIDRCPSCETEIRGFYWGSGGVGYDVPPYCHECGEPYPWTKAELDAAEEIIRLNEILSDSDKDALVGAVRDVTTDNPKTKVAAEKIKLYGKKAGEAGYKIILEVVSDVASETAKKMLGLKA